MIPTFDRIKTKAEMAQHGVTAADIARALGYERQTIGHWLRGRGEPTMKQIHQMAQVIGCHWLELVRSDATVINDPIEKRRTERIRSMSPERQALLDALIESMERQDP